MHRLLSRAVSVRTPRSPFLFRSDRFLSSSLGLELDRWKLNDAYARYILRTRLDDTVVDARYCDKTWCGRFTKLASDKRIHIIFRSTIKNGEPILWTSDSLTPFLEQKKGLNDKLVSEYLKDAKDNEWRFCLIVEKDNYPRYYVKTKIVREDEGETAVHVVDDYGALDIYGFPKDLHPKPTLEEVKKTMSETGLIQDIFLNANKVFLTDIQESGLILLRWIIGIRLFFHNEDEKMRWLRYFIARARKF